MRFMTVSPVWETRALAIHYLSGQGEHGNPATAESQEQQEPRNAIPQDWHF